MSCPRLLGLMLAIPSVLGVPVMSRGQPAPDPAATVDLTDAGSASSEPVITPLQIDESITVDGVLDEPSWSRAAAVTESFQDTPTYGAPHPVSTTLRVLYDHDSLYVGFKLQTWKRDEPVAFVRTRDDDSMFLTDDVVGLGLGVPEGAGTVAILAVNAAGTQFDFVTDSQGNPSDYDFEYSATTTSSEGYWYLELKIPWRELPLARTHGVRDIRLAYKRFHPARGATYSWPKIPQGIIDRLPQYYGHLTPIRDVAGRFGVRILPYATWQLFRFGDEPSLSPRAGADVRVLVGGFAADFTFLPDLSDVRPDDQTVNLNRFSLFRPELRPFFQAGLDVFNFGAAGLAQVFYSRRIGLTDDGKELPILAGVKGYGRSGRLSAGILGVLTAPEATPVTSLRLTPTALHVVGGARMRVSSAVQVGALATGVVSKRSLNGISSGVDLEVHKGLWEVRAFSSGTYESTDDDLPLGLAHSVSAKWTGRRLRPEASLLVINRTFDPLVGFVLRQDLARSDGRVGLVMQYDGWFKELEIAPTGTIDYDHAFERRLGHAAGVDVTTKTAFWSLSGSVRNTREVVLAEFTLFDQLIPAGAYEGGVYTLQLQRSFRSPLFRVSYQRSNAFFDGRSDTFSGDLSWAFGTLLWVSVNAAHTIAALPTKRIPIETVNASLRLTPTDQLQLQSLAQYNSFSGDLIGVGSLIWQWSSRSRLSFQLEHQPRFDGTSETQVFIKAVKDISL